MHERGRNGQAILRNGLWLVIALAFTSLFSAGLGRAAESRDEVSLRIDAGRLLRALPDRAIFGHNLSFASRANEAWDPARGAFKQPFWQRFRAVNPGLLRFPGGNWSHGFHFNLAREGVSHWVNTGEVTPRYRPQDFLKTLHDLPDVRALIHLSPIWSSPEEVTAFVAYMIGKTSDRRPIGPDSWGRVDPRTGRTLEWHTVGHWARLREGDGQQAYRGMLYLQVGNEEWFAWCRDRVCDGRVDYYGRRRPSRQVTVEDAGLRDPVSGVEVEAYWPNYRAVYLRVRELFDAGAVKVGALVHARPDGVGGADAFFRTAGDAGKRWNVVLLGHLADDPEVTADFVTLHTYMYDKRGWEKDFPEDGTANLLFASDHLSARIDKIFDYAKSPRRPVMVTEFNVHLANSLAPSSLLSALFYLDYSMNALRDDDIIGMARWQTANWRQRASLRGAALLVTEAGRAGKANGLWKMAPYYAAKLLGSLHKRVVAATIENAPSFRPRGLSGRWTAEGEAAPWWRASALPLVTAVATLSDDGRELAVLVLNKSTKQAFDVQIRLDNFRPRAAYSRIVLNSLRPGGHRDIFRINPWRHSKNGRCVPEDGGCTRTLAPEAQEQVRLFDSIHRDAGASFSVTVPAHSASLLSLTSDRPEGAD